MEKKSNMDKKEEYIRILSSDNKKFVVPRKFLEASPFFAKMLSSKLKEGNINPIAIPKNMN